VLFQDPSQAVVRQCDDRVFIKREPWREPGGEDGIVRILAARMDGGDARSHRALAGPRDQSRMSDLDTLDIGDGIIRTGAPSKATLRSLARGFVSAKRVAADQPTART